MNRFRMTLSRRRALALSALAVLPHGARADTYPSKTIRIIVPFAPGGSGDITSRLIGKYIEDKTGQPFVIENKPGANGIVGVLAVKAAAADGYTLMLATTSTNAANIHMFKNPGYDPEKDFQVVGVIGSSGAFLVVPADSPYKTLNDLLAYAKANPGKLNFGYFNASSQVPAEVLGKRAGVDWQGVAYKAIGNAWTDLYAGAIQFMFVDLTAGRGQVVANKARPLALTLPQRSPLYPDLPTLAESFPGFTSTGFLAVAVPKATPRAIQERLNLLVNEAITSPEINKRLTDEFALNSRPLTLEQCAQQDRDERMKWAEYVKIARIEPQ
jgi:tripartite-type tricarboxylate transporter receptor subunit TctC